jgi:hypothetical protein
MAPLHKVIVPAGSDAVFYIDGKIIQRETYTTEARVFTQSEYFIGTAAEVDAYILSNSLS